MILIVDKTVSARAAALRETLHSLGCPCAVSVPSEIKLYTPFMLILTFTDVLNEVRCMPFDNIHAVVIGDGFVNSALNAEKAPDEMSAIHTAHSYLMKSMGLTPDRILPFGVLFPPALFVSQDFIEIYGNMIPLTPTEAMITKLLLGMSSEARPLSAEVITEFVSPSIETHSCASIPVHVSHINAKAAPHLGMNLILSKKGIGYYSVISVGTALCQNTKYLQ